MDLQKLQFNYLLEKLNQSLLTANIPVASILIKYFIALFLLSFTLFVIRRLFAIKRSLAQDFTLLELTPPAITEKTAYTTRQLFSVIHNLAENRTFIDKLIGQKTIISLEIVSTRSKGIRYLIRTSGSEAVNIKRDILSYMPSVSVKTVEDYLPKDRDSLKKSRVKVTEFKLKGHFAYPLKGQDALKEHDPVAYITGMMTKLKPSELISFQVAISPAQRKEGQTIKEKILKGEDVLGYLNKSFFSKETSVIQAPFKLISVFINTLASIVGWAFQTIMNDINGVRAQEQGSQLAFDPKKAHILNPFEKRKHKID